MTPCLTLKKFNNKQYHENCSQSIVPKEFSFLFLWLDGLPLNGCAIIYLFFNEGHSGCLKCFAIGKHIKFFHRYCQFALHKGCTNLHSDQQSRRVCSPTSSTTWCIIKLFDLCLMIGNT